MCEKEEIVKMLISLGSFDSCPAELIGRQSLIIVRII